jgi:hypothetical protein
MQEKKKNHFIAGGACKGVRCEKREDLAHKELQCTALKDLHTHLKNL